MLVVRVRLLHETIRTGSPDDTVMAGDEPVGEWPPSPARLFSALVAADGTRERSKVTDGSELVELEQLAPPRILADAEVETTALRPRFVVKDKADKTIVQNYPARSAAKVRPGVKLSPENPVIAYVWDENVSEETLARLRLRAARIGYLGCADSPVQVTVTNDATPERLAEWLPGSLSGKGLPVPYMGFTEALDYAFDEWSSGRAMRRSWIRTTRERYAPLTQDKPANSTNATVIWLEFDRRVSGRRALTVTQTLRAAVLDLYDRISGESKPAGLRAPWYLHGHSIPDDVTPPYQIARFLPLSNVGHTHSDGTIHGAAIWLPAVTPAEVVERVREVTYRLARERLRGRGIDVVASVRASGRSGKSSTRPERWSGPAKRWFSATPVVVQRGGRNGPDSAAICKWFEDAGHPQPVEIRTSPVPTAPGVVHLRPREVHRTGKERYPYLWMDIRFAHPEEGPICVGRSRSFGMGLFAPKKDTVGKPLGEI